MYLKYSKCLSVLLSLKGLDKDLGQQTGETQKKINEYSKVRVL